MKKIFSIFLILTAASLFLFCKKDGQINPATTNPQAASVLKINTLAENLQLPWGLAYFSNGDLLFTERSGKINFLKNGETAYVTLLQRSVNTVSEGGLLSIAIDPLFYNNHYVYIYETIGSGTNRVTRLSFQNNVLSEDRVIVDGIPYGVNHDGGALRFGPDGYLYIGTGDGLQPTQAQDKNSLAGKILRVSREGMAAAGNPFNTLIWTYGHRNVQGFTWLPGGQMLATEHGPSGENGWCCHDEINVIEPGKNYGWPLAYAGAETGTLTPALINSGNDTWAPSGCTWLGPSSIWPNCLVVASLKGERLIRFYINIYANVITSTSDTLQGAFHRLRNITESPDRSLVFCTSNINSIPSPATGDDKVYRLYKK